MPLRQGEEVRRAHFVVIAEQIQRLSIPLPIEFAERPFEGGSSRGGIAHLKQHESENAASHTRLRCATLAFGLPKEDFGDLKRLAMFAPHEALQTICVVRDEACGGIIPSAHELARSRIGRTHFVGSESPQPHCRVPVVGMQL